MIKDMERLGKICVLGKDNLRHFLLLSGLGYCLQFFIYLFFFFYFNLYIYPPDSQESDGGAIHRVSNYPDLLPEMPRYCFR